MTAKSGRHFLQIPGPSSVPDRILRAIDQPVIDHRGPDFAALATAAIAGMKRIFRTSGAVAIFPSSGTGAWEAALVNTLSPGDRVLAFETGQFATLWRAMAERLGIERRFHSRRLAPRRDRCARGRSAPHRRQGARHQGGDGGAQGDLDRRHQRRARDAQGDRRAPSIRHCCWSIPSRRSPSTDFRHDEWGVDVTIAGSQKGLMLPPGLASTPSRAKALAAPASARSCRAPIGTGSRCIAANETGFFPFTPSTNMLYGLREAIAMLEEEGLDNVFARHDRHAEATRRAVARLGARDPVRRHPGAIEPLTALLMPEGHNADAFRRIVLERFDMSLGAGLGKVAGKVFRIGHLGWFNELILMGTLAGVEMGLAVAGVPHRKGGVDAAMGYLAGNAGAEPVRLARAATQ